MKLPMNMPAGERHPVIAEDLEAILSRPEDWRRFSGSHVLIAGATSFLAAYLVEFLASLSERWPEQPVVIHALARSPEKLSRRFPHLSRKNWFRPIVQQLIHSPASPIHCAAVRMSASARPVTSATTCGG